MQNEKIKRRLRRLRALEQERKGWEEHWRELAAVFLPRQARFLNGSASGGKNGPNLVDSTGILAARTLASGMQSGLTSPARQWFRLSLQDKGTAKNEDTRLWLDHVQNAMGSVFARSNFYDSVHLLYHELGVFGTGCMVVEEDAQSILRCRTLTAGEYYLDAGADGRVNTLYRRIKMKPRQIAETWPQTCPERIKRLVEKENTAWIDVLHAVEPDREQDGGKPYRSIYILLDGGENGQEALEENGYFEFPALCPRWDVSGSEVYGKSPGMDALGDCKMLQRMRKDGVEALAKEVNPPLLVPANLQDAALNSTPGAINYVSPLAQGQQAITPLYQVRSNLPALEGSIADFRRQVQQIFFNDLFLMITQIDRRMTATEVAERNAEKMLLLGPVLDRLRSELFQPLTVRVFGLMQRNGLVPPPPPGLIGQELKIEFISILAQAQKSAGIAAVQQIVGFAGQAAQISPATLDMLDLDAALSEMADMVGVPPSLVRSSENVAEIRAEREAANAGMQRLQTAAQSLNMAGEAARTVKDSGLKPEEMQALAAQAVSLRP